MINIDDLAWHFNGSKENESALKPLCLEIEKHFKLPDKRLCRYFAISDDPFFSLIHGPHYRGFHVSGSGSNVPDYLNQCFFLPPQESYELPFEERTAFDNLIYIRNGTANDHTGFVSTYAHELQHFVQHGFTPKLSRVNAILRDNLKRVKPDAASIDLPVERDADIMSKRVTEAVCGKEAVEKLVAEQINRMEAFGDAEQRKRWVVYRDSPSSAPYDLAAETAKLVEKYRGLIDFDTDTLAPDWWKS